MAARVTWVEARDFRNHPGTRLDLGEGLTAVVGPNGEGKTNLLEAIFYLCALESPRVASDEPLVRRGAAAAYLRGELEASGATALVEVEIRPSGANRVQVNRSPVRRRRDVRRIVRAVFAGPDDLEIVAGEPGARRRFLDEAVRILWPAREGVITAYDRALRQRNRLLKDWDGWGTPRGLEAWDGELAAHGAALTAARSEAAGRIAIPAARAFEALSGGPSEPLTLTVEYRPSVSGDSLEAAFLARLDERRGDELVRRTTLVGPHRDDLALAVAGLSARGFASHGEASGAALCLRLGLASAVREELGEPPPILLDDPFSGLDPARRRRVAESLGSWGQLVIAVPDEAQVPEGAEVVRVRGGAVVGG